MAPGLRLIEYETTPLYNIKAVVQATGISPSTLRAWERRYNVCQPQRSASGYRLYSERDVAIIRWLKAQVDAGMSISQAVNWLDSIVDQSGRPDQIVLPGMSGSTGWDHSATPASSRDQIRDFSALKAELLQAILDFDEEAADVVIAEAFAMYPAEQIGESLFLPVLVEIGERWHRGEVSIAAEHYATNYLIQRLGALLRTIPHVDNGPLLWVGCAPTELHEVGALLLGVYLRRAGYRVHFLGQNLPAENFAEEVIRRQPAMVLFSATTVSAAKELGKLTAQLKDLGASSPVIGYGGLVFNRQPDLRDGIAGIYMGENAQEAVDRVKEYLNGRSNQKH